MDQHMLAVLDWARATEQPRSTIRELARVPARLGLSDADLCRLPNDLAFFERVVAPSNYGPVSRSTNLDRAAHRANSRIRALLRRYHARPDTTFAAWEVRAAWMDLVAVVRDNVGTLSSGRAWSQWAYRSLSPFTARARVRPPDLDQR